MAVCLFFWRSASKRLAFFGLVIRRTLYDRILLSRPAYGGWGAVKFALSGPFLESKHNSQSRPTFPLIFSFSSTLSGCFEGPDRRFLGISLHFSQGFSRPLPHFPTLSKSYKETKGSIGWIYYRLPWFFPWRKSFFFIYKA